MYKLKENVKLEDLRKYGFKPARELPDCDRWVGNDYWLDDMYLIPMNPDFPGKPYYADEEFDQLLWEIHVTAIASNEENKRYRIWIDCTPASTYHIDNMDTEPMFFAIYNMICDGIIEDDYEAK